MRSREIQQFLSQITGKPLGEVDQRCRGLREALRIPTGARGLGAPHQTVAAGMFHVLSMISRRPGDAYDVAFRLFEHCRLVLHPEYRDLQDVFMSTGPARSVGSFVLYAMMGKLSSAGFEFRSFSFADDGHLAWLELDRRSIRGIRFLFSTSWRDFDSKPILDADAYRKLDDTAAGSRFVIGAAHLRTLGERILNDCPEPKGGIEPPLASQEG